jgi:uncharacterized protein YqeY
MATVTIDLSKEELETAVREFAADKLEIMGEIEGTVTFTYAGKDKKGVSGASVTLVKE